MWLSAHIVNIEHRCSRGHFTARTPEIDAPDSMWGVHASRDGMQLVNRKWCRMWYD